MKCPKCGKEMYSSVSADSDTARGNYIDMKYVCPECGYEVKNTTDVNGIGMIGNGEPPVKTVPLTDVTSQPQVYKGVNNETNNT